MGEFVQVETGPAAVATIRLARPPMNALNTQVQTELREAAEQVSADDASARSSSTAARRFSRPVPT